MHRVDAAVWVCAREGEAVVLDVVVVCDQMNVEIIGVFCIIGVVNDGVFVELLNGLSSGLIRKSLE